MRKRVWQEGAVENRRHRRPMLQQAQPHLPGTHTTRTRAHRTRTLSQHTQAFLICVSCVSCRAYRFCTWRACWVRLFSSSSPRGTISPAPTRPSTTSAYSPFRTPFLFSILIIIYYLLFFIKVLIFFAWASRYLSFVLVGGVIAIYFHVCRSDPGRITPAYLLHIHDTHQGRHAHTFVCCRGCGCPGCCGLFRTLALYKDNYPYDGILYEEKFCKTCQLPRYSYFLFVFFIVHLLRRPYRVPHT